MENTKPTEQQVEQSEDILAKARANRKSIMWCFIAAFVVIIGAMVWVVVAQNGSRKADELVAKADLAQNDSTALSLYKEAAQAGHKSGNRAAAEVAIRLYRQGEYEQAIKYLDDCSLDDAIAAAGVYTLKGDCYVNLDQLDKALDCYRKAVSKADGNPEIVPLVLVKEANIYRAQEKYAEEAKAYKTILDDYPTYAPSRVRRRS